MYLILNVSMCLHGLHACIYFFEKQIHTHKREGKGFCHKSTPQLHLKAIVTFKRRWDNLYYTQHTLLHNVRQLPFFFLFFFFMLVYINS